MAQILDPVPQGSQDNIICSYVNSTSQIQVARITNIANWYFERVIFPGQRLVFEAVSGALLEIHSGMMASAILSDTIPCDRLSIQEQEPPTSAPSSNSVVALKSDRGDDSVATKSREPHYLKTAVGI